MKNLISIFFLLAIACDGQDFSYPQTACVSTPHQTYERAAALQEIMDRYAAQGIPGISIGIQKGQQRWEGAAGFAGIEQKIPLQNCHLMHSQSLAKTYTAVTILQLYEKGMLDLDKAIVNYMPESIHSHINYSDQITVRMLLNHTSGIFDYAYSYAYATYLLNNGDRIFSKDLLFDFILDRKEQFKPGEKYRYSNSNYFLLAYIAEEVTGKTHAQLIRENILEPLQLTDTYYREEIKQVVGTRLVNSYLDRFSDGTIENVSKQQLNNVLSMMGDDSIVATPEDYVDFLNGLLNAKLFSQPTLDMMKEWVLSPKGEPTYGLGLDYTVFDGKVGYGHSGGGLGAGCALYYFPDRDVTLFLGVNLSTLLGGPLVDKIEEMRKEIYNLVYEE